MIDHSLVISPLGALLFHLHQGFWLYAWPMMIGFVTIIGYQAVGRIVMMGAARWPVVFGLATLVSMLSLFGWVTMVRGIEMIPLYGCGVGLASAMMSRVYAITMPEISLPCYPKLKMRIIRIIWRGDAEGIEQLQRVLRARAEAAHRGASSEAGVEAARARV
ncbi:MAG: hypothetical protein JWO19_1770 [Bryobacterales bacterium]|nr:hypothetical protein [Bryobacterales bacterium]